MEGKQRKSLDVMFVVYLVTFKGLWKLASHSNAMENSVCKHCGDEFTYSSSLPKHMKRKHIQ